MALAKKSTAKTTEKLAVAERLGQVFISSVRTKKNTNGTEFISTPHGAVYANLSAIKVGLYTAVKLSNGAIALNDPYNEEVMGFINDKIGEYPNLSAGDIREMYSL
jgi:hypothetical protein